MRTLSEENDARRDAQLERERTAHLAPVVCNDPDCDTQMHYTTPGVTLTTDPPMTPVHCPECGERGYLDV